MSRRRSRREWREFCRPGFSAAIGYCGMESWRDRISIDPAIHHGDPCIKGTRVPVAVIVGSIADGDAPELLLKAYPSLTREDIQAALRFAAEAVSSLTDFT